MAGSQSLVCITDTFTTSATTTTATPGLVVATVSPLVSFPVAIQEFVAGPSCSFSGGSFYSTRQRTPALAKRARIEPPPPSPQKTPEIMSKESCGKDGKNKGGGGERGVKNLLLLLWAVLSPVMIQMLGIPSLLSPLGENLVSTWDAKPQKYISESSGLFSIIFYACVGG